MRDRGSDDDRAIEGKDPEEARAGKEEGRWYDVGVTPNILNGGIEVDEDDDEVRRMACA